MKTSSNVAAVYDRRMLIPSMAVARRATEGRIASCALRAPGQQVVRATQEVTP